MSKIFSIVFISLFVLSSQQCGPDKQTTKSAHFDREETSDSIFYNLVSTSPSPIELELGHKKDIASNIVLKEFTLLKSNDTAYGVLRFPKSLLDNVDEKSLIADHILIDYFYGNSKTAAHREDYLYALPFELGKSYKVSQSFYGKKSHFTTESKFAVDFAMPVGTKIVAAREGVVVYTLDQFKKSGGKEFKKKANKIVILHDDGTFASYSHLKHQGTVVQKGDRVEKGQHIGYSGNTGYTSGPHLHFAVRLPRDICVPVYFENYKGKVLKKGKYYKRIQ